MRRVILSILVLTCVGCHATTPAAISIDEILHQSGWRFGTFGPTGKRLFTERLDEGLGFRGQFSYIHYGEILDPIHLTLQQNGHAMPMEAEQVDWYPSHLMVRWGCGALVATERKFITEDDTLVNQLTLSNRSQEPVECSLRLISGFANRLERWGSTFTTVDVARIANANPFSGRDVFTGRGSADAGFRAWHEAEHVMSQAGAETFDPRPAASAGQVLGGDFGRSSEHFAVFEFATPAIPAAHLYLRVARHEPEPAIWKLELDEKKIGTIHIEDSGGWGDADKDFHWVHFGLGELLPGGHTLRFAPQRSDQRTNFDGFFISAEAFTPPTSAADDAFSQDVIEQIAYRPTRKIIDGVPFTLIDPEKNDGRGVIVARDVSVFPHSEQTREIVIPVPAGDANLIHFCGQIAGRLNEVNFDVPIAEYDLQFADGESERILLTAGDALKPTWTGLNVLTHSLPADRQLLNVVFRAKSGMADAVLAAITLERFPEAGPDYHLLGSDMFYGVRAHGVIASSGFVPVENESAMLRDVRLAPGESLSVPLALSFAADIPTAERTANVWASNPDAFVRHTTAYQSWFEQQCPRFDCDDPYLTRLYWYRWFLARHCLSGAATGNLVDPCFFEAMHGPEFTAMNAGSSSQIISEVRWLSDPMYAFGQVRNHARSADEFNHYFRSARVDWAGNTAANGIGKAAWEACWVHPDTPWLREVMPNLAGDVLGVLYEFDRDQDRLPAYPGDSSPATTGRGWMRTSTTMERPDSAALLYGNAAAVSQMYKHLGHHEEARNFNATAEGVRDACLSKQWDEGDRFAYAISEDEDTRSSIREVAGFYPFMTGLIPDEARFNPALEYLVDPAEFWTPFPPSTLSKKARGYTPTPAQSVSADQYTTGASRFLWKGANHPSAASAILNVLAAAVQPSDARQSIEPEHFWHALQQYTHMQFDANDLTRPITRECYNAENGIPAGTPDHFASTFCDLIIRHVAGLQPADSRRLTIRPIPGPLKRFSLHRVRYRGHSVDVVYNRAGGGFGGGPNGLTVWIDGRWSGHRNSLGEITVELPEIAQAAPPPKSPWDAEIEEKQIQ